MSSDRSDEFARALLRPDLPAPDGLVASRRPSDANPLDQRLAVYRNTVVASLVDTLEGRFPITCRILGRDFFRAAGCAFAMAHPPRSKVLMAYGDGLPAFLAGLDQMSRAPFVPDVARLEAAIGRALHAADADPVGIAALAALPDEALNDAQLVLHPSVELVASHYPIATIRERETRGEGGPKIDMAQGEDVMVLRPQLDIVTCRLPAGAHPFIEALLGQAPLARAAEAGAAREGFDLPANLAALFEAGAVVDVIPADRPT